MSETTHGSASQGSAAGSSPPAPTVPLPASAKARGSRHHIYLSWGGEIYGPSSREEVLAGLRTSWFEQGALYWHEGLDEWKPVQEFATSAAVAASGERRSVRPGELPAAPSLPAKRHGSDPLHDRARRARGPKPTSRPIGTRGLGIFLGFALLAVLLTVGILLLLMLI